MVRHRSGPSRPEFATPEAVQSSAQRPPEDLVGRIFLGQYVVERLISSGSMGHVFLGRQLKLERPVAIKLITGTAADDPRFLKRFSREASLAAQLAHPNIVSVYDYGEGESGDLFLVMEHLVGRSLDKMVAEGPLPPVRALSIAIQVARAARKAHQAGVVHRDLKPSNVMIRQEDDESEAVKVLDFGLAKLFAVEGASLRDGEGSVDIDPLTRPGSMVGTPNYVSPEQAMGDPVDGRADVYSLGVMLFEMVAGQLPFTGENIGEVVRKHLREPVPRVAQVSPEVECPPEIEAIIFRAMGKLPEHRFESMDAMLVALKRAYEALTDAPMTPTDERSRPQHARFSPDFFDELSTDACVAVARASALSQEGVDPTISLPGGSMSSGSFGRAPRPPVASGPPLERTRWLLLALVFSSLGLVLAILGAVFSPRPPLGEPTPGTSGPSSSRPSAAPAEVEVAPTPSAPPIERAPPRVRVGDYKDNPF